MENPEDVRTPCERVSSVRWRTFAAAAPRRWRSILHRCRPARATGSDAVRAVLSGDTLLRGLEKFALICRILPILVRTHTDTLKLWRGGECNALWSESRHVGIASRCALPASPWSRYAPDHAGAIFRPGYEWQRQGLAAADGGRRSSRAPLSVTGVEGSSPTQGRHAIVVLHQLCRMRSVALRDDTGNFDVVLYGLRAASGGLAGAATDGAGHQIQRLANP